MANADRKARQRVCPRDRRGAGKPACEKSQPHPEERRFLTARLEGWPLAQQCLLPSFETAAQEGGLLRMRSLSHAGASSGLASRWHGPCTLLSSVALA